MDSYHKVLLNKAHIQITAQQLTPQTDIQRPRSIDCQWAKQTETETVCLYVLSMLNTVFNIQNSQAMPHFFLS